MDLFSTIAAISTPAGSGGISIIRISGSNAIEIADSIFKSSSGKKLCEAKSHTIHHGFIANSDGKAIDEALVSVMLSPHTYTGENTAEINCHGSAVSTRAILDACYMAGAVPAARGEFTKRAFLNGRIDLSKAEAVIDIINSKTNLEQSVSVNQLGGRLSEKINDLRDKILSLLAHVQVLIDYPDEELEPLSDDEFYDTLCSIGSEIEKLLSTADRGQLIRDGINAAIIGKPNVGKSSLLNLLFGDERAIVTDIEGTTRDAVIEYVNIGNVTLHLADTAGIRETDDIIEEIGVKKSLDILSNAQLVIFMADAVSGIDENDRKIIEKIGDRKKIALINKSDIGNKIKKEEISSFFDYCIDFSVKEESGVEALEKAITDLFEMGEIENSDRAIITNARHRDALLRAEKSIKSAIDALRAGIPADTTFIDLEDAASSLGEIVGLSVSEEVIDKIFHRFCVGK